MAGWSKFKSDVEVHSCKTMAHPWTDHCLLAAGYTWFESLVGSAGFFAVLYSLQYASVLLKKKKADVKPFLKKLVRSTVFGATLTATAFFFHCRIRKLIGMYTAPTMVFLPAFLGGFAIYLESRSGRELFTNSFANGCFELWLKLLEKSNILKWNSNIQTIVFMILSSVVSFMLSWTGFDINYFWFFPPPKVSESDDANSVCFHKEDCRKHIGNLFLMYSTTGFVLQFLKLFLNNLKNPKVILSSLIRPRTFKLGAFLGGYVAIFQAIRCFLYQRERKYSLNHDSIAGLLAGVAFRFQPNIPIFNSAIITIIQILTEAGLRKKLLPNFHYLETLFAFFCGLLFHYGIVTNDCPQLILYFMSAVTNGMSERISSNYDRIKAGLIK